MCQRSLFRVGSTSSDRDRGGATPYKELLDLYESFKRNLRDQKKCHSLRWWEQLPLCHSPLDLPLSKLNTTLGDINKHIYFGSNLDLCVFTTLMYIPGIRGVSLRASRGSRRPVCRIRRHKIRAYHCTPWHRPSTPAQPLSETIPSLIFLSSCHSCSKLANVKKGLNWI